MPKLDLDQEATSTLWSIEKEWPPSRCSLKVYRDFLHALDSEIRERIVGLNEEISP